MFIQTEVTPNPATLKFLPGRDVLPGGAREFKSRAEAAGSPLATRATSPRWPPTARSSRTSWSARSATRDPAPSSNRVARSSVTQARWSAPWSA